MDYAYKVGDKILIVKYGILRKAESPNNKDLCTIKTVHTNRTIRVTHGAKSEQLNVWRVKPCLENA